MEQIVIAFTSSIAVWLSQDTRLNVRKWASVLGLLGQPVWFYTTYKAQQWGMFAASVIFTISWAKGFINHWVRK